ncbi:MAG TPA: membrane protein insertase YidC [Rhodanobacteraceae bacterium]|nr:membrane protein insertase YidC [Rhodanobacteraceae bacterium]
MINQTRILLVVALLFVGFLLWRQWQHDYPPAPPPAVAATANVPVPTSASVPQATAASPAASATPAASAPAGQVPEEARKVATTPAADLIVASTDVLRLTIDPRGGTILDADLLGYPDKVAPGSPPVRLLDAETGRYYVAQNGLVGAAGSAAPDHQAEFTATRKRYTLAGGQNALVVTLDWSDPATGIGVVKRYTLTRGSYVVKLTQEITNHGAATWHGNAYEQLERVEPPPPPKHLLEFYNPESLAFTGAAWYSPGDKYNKLKFGDFASDPLHKDVTGGWIAMSQRFFLGAWIPEPKEAESFTSLALPGIDGGKPRYLIRTMGPGFAVAPGASATRDARLYVGPKLQNHLASVAPGLDLTVNYMWSTVIAQPLFKLLSFLDRLVGNWGLAIIVLVLIIQGAIYKLTDTQYRASARMRKLTPRLKALKERFGDDKQKYQQAMMELYKKEKVNPMAGCLPTLIPLPIFFALYYVLILSVELRHARFLWIPDLSAADPYFVLPVLYALTMLGQQFLTPVQGMDPNQARIMKAMPVLLAVLFFFFPAGLTLYYVVRGICLLGQQWYVTRQVDRAEAHARA